MEAGLSLLCVGRQRSWSWGRGKWDYVEVGLAGTAADAIVRGSPVGCAPGTERSVSDGHRLFAGSDQRSMRVIDIHCAAKEGKLLGCHG